jgi:YhcH/YjgK/YiaL family protein
MIVDKLQNLPRYLKSHCIEIEEFLLKVSRDMEDGEYPIVGSDVFARVMSYDTKPEHSCSIEAHNVYVDIQSTLAGVEGIGMFDREMLEHKTGYDEDNDVVFFEGSEPLFTVAVKEGYFAMIFPHEAHRPQTMVKKEEAIRKFVIKVKKDLLV